MTVPEDATPGTVYGFTLTIWQGGQEQSRDYMTVTVVNPTTTDGGQTDKPRPNSAPVFSDGISTARSIAENSGAGVNVGAPVFATDLDGDALTYTLSGPDAAAFALDKNTGQLTTVEGVTYDYETKSTYTVVVNVNDGYRGAAGIAVTITVLGRETGDAKVVDPQSNSGPVFSDESGDPRSVAENSPAGTKVGTPVTASDPDGDALKYTLSGTDAASFAIDEDTGQITTVAGVTYDYEAKATYSLTVTADDGNGGTAAIAITVTLTDVDETQPNQAPTFSDEVGTSISIAENVAAGTNVGAPVTASDPDSDALKYALSGTDAASFAIDEDTGQITTVTGVTYDYETKSTYELTVSVSDGKGGTASIAVTVSLTDVDEAPPNRAPVFNDGTSATRSIAENSEAGVHVGDPITATDLDGDALTYTLSGTDAASFEIGRTSGQLTTKSGVTYDYETKSSYELTVNVSDGNGVTASIAVTVTLTDVDETPPEPQATPVTACFTDLGTLSSAAEYAGAWDDADCQAHHQDGRGRYFHFTLSAESTVSISLSAGALYVSKDTPQNGWGTAPKGTYEHRRNVRRDNGKLVHDGTNSVTLTLAAGETYTVEAAGGAGDFTISIAPQ